MVPAPRRQAPLACSALLLGCILNLGVSEDVAALRGPGIGTTTAKPAAGESGDSSALILWLVLFLVLYGGLYAGICYKFRDPKSPQRRSADYFLCCWRDLYHAKAFWLYNVIFSPVLLVIHAFRIYVVTCVHIYWIRLVWLVMGTCSKFYCDDEFPPNARSLGAVGGDSAHESEGKSDSEVIWVRAMDLTREDISDLPKHPKLHDTDMCLFEGEIQAADILQGALGDCWLLAAMATVSEHHGAISRLFVTREIDPAGKYELRIFDPQEERWRIITVDDYLPCKRDPRSKDGVARGRDGYPEVLYAKPHDREVWAVILEKAIAKLCGSYQAIEAGITEWGIMCLTGGKAWRYEAKKAQDGATEWSRVNLVCFPDPKDKRTCGFREANESHDEAHFFELLRHYHRNGAVLCCGGVTDEGVAQGLVQKHAFSLLQIRSVRSSPTTREYYRFVQVRNPWGTGEWTGSWSDNSPLWDEYPLIKHELDFKRKDDGAYWMQWEDFVKYWGYVGCVDCTTDIFSLRPPLYNETERAGPLQSFCLGCGDFWCLCSGLSHMLTSHDASDKKLSAQEFETTCGIDPSGVYCRLCEHERVHVENGKVVKVKGTGLHGCSVQ
mmetsp:Transcript_54236/g.117263  ORF Transcript_54236/g.117263 Transcript_54236/m.117263 type:complete len:609 (+) Transcript_54236:56-1882(+)